MIASLRGTALHVGLGHVVLEVGGVGMHVHTTPATAASCHRGTEVTLATTLVVREESLTLYGFESPDARALFEQVQTVSGVGPRLALAMLSVHTPDDVRRAISAGDVVALTKVPGIGRKSAERLVLELRDTMVVLGGGRQQAAGTGGVQERAAGQVREALVGLGWSAKQADEALAAVAERGEVPGEVSVLLRAALRELGR
jgi:Holliday junction DNA helicase RuvA